MKTCSDLKGLTMGRMGLNHLRLSNKPKIFHKRKKTCRTRNTNQAKKEPWEMTRGEYDAKPIKAGPATISHKFLIERAMAKGKTIPAEVLADYPKLAEKVNQKSTRKPQDHSRPTRSLTSRKDNQSRI